MRTIILETFTGQLYINEKIFELRESNFISWQRLRPELEPTPTLHLILSMKSNKQEQDQKQFHIKEEVDFGNRISQKTESIVLQYENTYNKFVEKENMEAMWKPQQTLERKTHDREAGQGVT